MNGDLNDGENREIHQESPRQIRSDAPVERESERGSLAGVENTGGTVQSERECLPERTRIRGVRGGTAIGGILILFLQQEQDKLQNSLECIEWYEREKQRSEARIAELQARLEALQAGVEVEED